MTTPFVGPDALLAELDKARARIGEMEATRTIASKSSLRFESSALSSRQLPHVEAAALDEARVAMVRSAELEMRLSRLDERLALRAARCAELEECLRHIRSDAFGETSTFAERVRMHVSATDRSEWRSANHPPDQIDKAIQEKVGGDARTIAAAINGAGMVAAVDRLGLGDVDTPVICRPPGQKPNTSLHDIVTLDIIRSWMRDSGLVDTPIDGLWAKDLAERLAALDRRVPPPRHNETLREAPAILSEQRGVSTEEMLWGIIKDFCEASGGTSIADCIARVRTLTSATRPCCDPMLSSPCACREAGARQAIEACVKAVREDADVVNDDGKKYEAVFCHRSARVIEAMLDGGVGGVGRAMATAPGGLSDRIHRLRARAASEIVSMDRIAHPEPADIVCRNMWATFEQELAEALTVVRTSASSGGLPK